MNPLILNHRELIQQYNDMTELRRQSLVKGKSATNISALVLEQKIIQLLDLPERKRIIVGIAGFPASGKTTIAQDLSMRLNSAYKNISAYIPMDGFHFSAEKLNAIGLDTIKGNTCTYDVKAYESKLQEFKRSLGHTFFAPDYVRAQHDVFENVIEIHGDTRVLITEGIYVGYPDEGWSEISKLLDILVYLDETVERCADRIVARNLQASRSIEIIEMKLRNDLGFMKKSLQIMEFAKYIVTNK
jgi:pantothenate kinase